MPMICRSRADSRAWEDATCWLVVVDTGSLLTLSTSAYGTPLPLCGGRKQGRLTVAAKLIAGRRSDSTTL